MIRVWPAVLVVVLLASTCAVAQGQNSPKQPEKTYAVKVYYDQKIRMRDGIELSADLYRPDAQGKYPCIVTRTPYLKGSSELAFRIAKYFAEHGYVFVHEDVRGRGDSPGTFVPYRDDAQDGYDTIEWCAAQPWSTGKVGTWGGSYTGVNQWLAAVTQPPHLATMVVMASPSDPFVEFPTGMPIPQIISWDFATSGHVMQSGFAVDWPAVLRHLPLLTMDDETGRRLPHWRNKVEHSPSDRFWDPERYQGKYDRVQVPVLHMSGWYDDEQIGTPLNFMGMTTKGPEAVRRSQKMIIGPWPHNLLRAQRKLGDVDFGPDAVIDFNNVMLRWYDTWLKGIDNGTTKEPPVRLFVMGENRWTDEQEWPIARACFTRYYFHSNGQANSVLGDGSLSPEAPGAEKKDGYAYNPAEPVPFITEATSGQVGGPDDYRSVERRNDVLVYSSEPMQNDMEVCGPVKVTLDAASSAKDTDFTAKLVDVWPDGVAQRLSDGMVRARFRNGLNKEELIEPGKIYTYSINAWNTCQVFLKGHRIRLEISSSAFPKYDRNLNTGAPLGKTAEMVTAEQTIYHDSQHPSFVELPIISLAQ